VTLDKAIEVYLREALKAFEKQELDEYAKANVQRDLLAATRFVDFLFGHYQGKGK
jgi:hypothetical protein